jgi:hypothetical protein
MTMRNKTWAMLLAIGFALLAICQNAFADEPVPSDRRLPKNVVAYMSLRDVADFKSQWTKTLFGQMVNDDALADFRADVLKHFNEASEKVESELGIGLSDLLSIPHGEIAAAGVALPGGKLSGVLFLDFGDRQEAVQKLIDKAAESLGEKHKRTEEEVDDTKIIAYQAEGEDGKKPQDVAAYFMKDSFLVIGTHVAALKEVLTRWDGKHDRTLADNETYHYILDKCRDEASDAHPQIVWYLNPVALVQSVVASQPQLPAQVAMAMGVIPVIGLDKFKGMGGTLDMAHGEFDTVSRMLFVLDRSNQGIVNVFQFDSAAMAPPKWLSSDWSGYMAINWNAAKAYATVETLVDMLVGPGTLANQVQNFADNQDAGGIHLKKDVIDQLTGMFHIVQDDGASGGKSAAEGTVYGIQIKNAAAARATLAKIAGMPGVKITEREFQGETLYEMETAAGDDDDDDDAGSGKMGFAVTEGHVMIATDVRLLERVLRGVGDRETLTDSAAYKHIARKFPTKTNSIGYNRQDTQFKGVIEDLKSGQLIAQINFMALRIGFEGFEVSKVFDFSKLDYSKLPDFDTLKKYMPPSGSYMEQDARGLKITSFSLRNDSE